MFVGSIAIEYINIVVFTLYPGMEMDINNTRNKITDIYMKHHNNSGVHINHLVLKLCNSNSNNEYPSISVDSAYRCLTTIVHYKKY